MAVDFRTIYYCEAKGLSVNSDFCRTKESLVELMKICE